MSQKNFIMAFVCSWVVLPVMAIAGWSNSLGMTFEPVPGQKTKMCIWETRVQDFAAFVDATGYDASQRFFYYRGTSWNIDTRYWRDPGFNQTNTSPVVGISWRDAVAFCEWLTETERKSGVISSLQAYRLPTDREWTIAAGRIIDLKAEKIPANFHYTLEMDGFEFTSPVGSFPANEYGFYDMAGNAWEYCLDQASTRRPFRVIRGGSWQNWHARYVGVQAKGQCGMDVRITLYGFRVVLDDENDLTRDMRDAAKSKALPQADQSEE
jgi:formylglycine-generating enzyme required for sulfatase activity